MAVLLITRNNTAMIFGTKVRCWWSVGRRVLLLGTVAMLVGCATSGNPRDPLEPVNRAIFSFNDGFDQVIAEPVAEGYRAAVPSFARTGITNFFANLGDLWIAINDLIQGKPGKALDDWTRVFVNTTVGIFGLYDIASDLGLEKRNEDFGQTLGRWGVGSGPYLVLPFVGPSTVRDALSYALVDVNADLVLQHRKVPARNTLFVARIISQRANLLDASKIVEEAALDKYTFTRDAYLQYRQNLVYDGNPPRDDRVSSETVDENDSPVAGGPSATESAGDAPLTSSPPTPMAGLPAPTQQ